MPNDGPVIVPPMRVALVDRSDTDRTPDVRTRATRDHSVIQRWAEERGAEPAIGEDSPSGPRVSFDVNDGDAGIRFNFPGHARFRGIGWAEWFDHLDRHDLTFLYERDEPGQPVSYRWRLMPTARLRASAEIV